MAETNTYERSLKDTTNYVAEYNTACLWVKLGRRGFQGNLVEILYGRKATFYRILRKFADVEQKLYG